LFEESGLFEEYDITEEYEVFEEADVFEKPKVSGKLDVLEPGANDEVHPVGQSVVATRHEYFAEHDYQYSKRIGLQGQCECALRPSRAPTSIKTE